MTVNDHALNLIIGGIISLIGFAMGYYFAKTSNRKDKKEK